MGNSTSSPQYQPRQRRETRTYTGPQRSPPARPVLQMIPDEFTSVDQVTQALRRNGLESCNLIIGMDFTKSNEWSGKRTFHGRSLHNTDDVNVPNPYEDVLESIGLTLRDFDEDNSIPVFGFGDDITADNSVFTFANDASSAQTGFPFETIRWRYRDLVPNVVMAGPTSFAPLINQAVNIVNQTGQYHILVIIADGQVTRSVDIPPHAVSKNEKETIDAITYASNFPLSIVMVGVGDGPWESMIYFDNYLVNRKFDNFQFVEFNKIASQATSRSQKLAKFSLQALMEVPEQYKTIKQLGYLNKGPYQFAQNVPEVMVFPAPTPIVPAYPVSHANAFPVATHPTNNGGSCGSNYSLTPAPRPAVDETAFQGRPVDTLPPSYDSAVSAPSAPPVGDATSLFSGSSVQAATSNSRPNAVARQASKAEMELSQLQESLLCIICEDRTKDTVFQCGHETCSQCATMVAQCPTCRQEIQVRIRRYGV